MKTLAALALVLLASTAFAKDLDPTEAAQIAHDRQQALDKISSEHGNKKESEMGPAERRQVVEEQQKASLEVLDKHGVSDKDYSRYQATLPPAQRAQEKAAGEAIEKKAAAAKGVKPGDPNAAKPADQVVVLHGNAGPQTIDAKTGKTVPGANAQLPTVERGAPPQVSHAKTSRHHRTTRSHHRKHHRR